MDKIITLVMDPKFIESVNAEGGVIRLRVKEGPGFFPAQVSVFLNEAETDAFLDTFNLYAEGRRLSTEKG